MKSNFQLKHRNYVAFNNFHGCAVNNLGSKLKLQKMRKSQKIKRYIQWLTDDSYVCYMYQKRKPKEQLAKGLAQLKNITYISRQQMEQKMGAKIRGEFVFFVEDKNGGLLDIAVFEKGERQ